VTFRVLGHRRLATGVFLRFDREHLIGPDNQPLRRDVVRHPGGVAVLPVEDDAAWFISQRRAPFGTTVLEVPAGRLDPSDREPETAAIRELAEELGAEADELIPLTATYPSPGYTDEVLHLFAARGLRFSERRLQGAEERESTLISLPIDEAVSRIERGLIRDAKTQVAVLMWARRRDRL